MKRTRDAEGFHTLRKREVRGVLRRVAPIEDAALRARITAYAQEGVGHQDLRYVCDVYGLVNASGRQRQFGQFWETPSSWMASDALNNNNTKRESAPVPKSAAVRSYLRASSTAPPPVDEYMASVDRLTKWSERAQGREEDLKTVSRMIQSFEHTTLTRLSTMLRSHDCRSLQPARAWMDQPDVPTLACTVRRHEKTFHLFAAAVAMELLWHEATNGTRNTTIYMCRQLEDKRTDAALALLRMMAVEELERYDTVGLPLTETSRDACVTHGILVVVKKSKKKKEGGAHTNDDEDTLATYVLEIIEDDDDEANIIQMDDVARIAIVAAN